MIILSRPEVFKYFATCATSLTVYNNRALLMSPENENHQNEKTPLLSELIEPIAEFHLPPQGSGISYDSNPTVFGRILDGTSPCRAIDESDELLVFHDRTPRAPLHALVIPKRYIPSVITLDPTTAEDWDLVVDMKRMALQTIQMEQPLAYEQDDYILCFHIPPFISVPHLHLHVLAPASEMKWQYRYFKYLGDSMWSIDVDRVLDSLEEGNSIRPFIC